MRVSPYLIFTSALAVFLFFAPVAHAPSAPATPTVEVGGQLVHVAIAGTSEARAKGLGGRDMLGENEGMFFVFPEDGHHSFWMKDMRFAIDILWIGAGGAVVDIASNVSPGTYPATFSPRAPARYVLEVEAGFASANGVAVGDVVRLPTN